MKFLFLLFSFGLSDCLAGKDGCLQCNINGYCNICMPPKYVKTEGPNPTCVCNTEQLYYNTSSSYCEKAEECPVNDKLCQYCIGATCVACDKEKHLVYSDNAEHYPKCVCDDNYALDEYKIHVAKSSCISLFPERCREGCNCDKNNINCLSCKENYIPEYYDDLTTIAKCIPIYECPSTAPANCAKCNKDQKCIECKNDLYYIPNENRCAKRSIFDGQTNLTGCIYGKNGRCYLCEKEYELAQNGLCNIIIARPKKSLYGNIEKVNLGTNVISKNDDQIEFNLKHIEESKIRPYIAEIDSYTINKVLINNDNSFDFAVHIYHNDEVTIGPLPGSSSDPPVTIIGDEITVNLQTKKASLFEPHSFYLSTANNEIIELDKVITGYFDSDYYYYQSSSLYVNQAVQINEWHFYASSPIQIQSITGGDPPELKITTLHVHQGSTVNFQNNADIGTIILETGSSIKIYGGFHITVHNIIIKSATTDFSRRNFGRIISGAILNVPESIKLDLHPNDTLVYTLDYLFPTISAVYCENQEFFENCEKWAKVYNDHPTDGIYNVAQCYHSTGYVALKFIHPFQESSSYTEGSNKTLMIVGIVMAVIVAIIVAVILIYFLVIKPRQAKKKHNLSENENIMKENAAEVV